jgi:hypothetical protein
MCEKDKIFCSLVTTRSPDRRFDCIDLWIEDFVHELRIKYGIKRKHNNSSSN